MTPTEAVLWEFLRARRLENLKFRRLAPAAGFIGDFACHDVKLVVELDGGIHNIREIEDCLRDTRMRAEGYTVLRCPNAAFRNNPNVLLDAIRVHVSGRV